MAEYEELQTSKGGAVRIPYDRRENILFKFPDTWMPAEVARVVCEATIKVLERLEGKEKKPTTQQHKREGVTTDVTQDTTTSLKESLCKTCINQKCKTRVAGGNIPNGVDCDLYQKEG